MKRRRVFLEGEGLPFKTEGAVYYARDISNQDGRFDLKVDCDWKTVYWGDYIVMDKGRFDVEQGA